MDPVLALARLAVEHAVRHGRPLPEVPPALWAPLQGLRAGVFVSLHTRRDHELRGCIGTLGPTRACVADEIVSNALAAALRDARFAPVQPDELEDLDVKVDVLGEPWPVEDRAELDPRRYGVIVSSPEGRRGVLLPDLEGVETVDQQLAIACRKAGLDPKGSFTVQAFTVTRHSGD